MTIVELITEDHYCEDNSYILNYFYHTNYYTRNMQMSSIYITKFLVKQLHNFPC